MNTNRLVVWTIILIFQLSIILSDVGIVSAEDYEEVELTNEEIDQSSSLNEEDGSSTIDSESPDAETDEEIVQAVKDTLVIGYSGEDSMSNTTNNLNLPTSTIEDVAIRWASDKPEIIAIDGIVKRPNFSLGNQLVTLTATISKGEVSDSKVYQVTVLALAEKIAPMLTAGVVERLSPTTAKVKFASSKSGHYYYELVRSGDPAPEINVSTEGTSLSTEEETINLSDLDVATQDVYIIVKDDDGTFSEKLILEIPEFKEITKDIGRHVKVGNDVFLGGKYIEVGISKSGSFGTESNAPNGFHPIKRLNLGFVFDDDGFDIGNAMTNGDYFLPGGPYEGFIVGYNNGGSPFTYLNAERSGSIKIPSESIEDISTEKVLAAKTSGHTSDEKLKVEQTVSFTNNDKFFKMTVLITNNTESILNDVRYMRSVDPDVDYDMGDTFETINSVPYNYPNDTKSVALSKGPVTGNALVLMSTDSRSRASLETVDPYSLQAFNDDGIIAESTRDTRIGLTFTLGNLAPGQTETIEYYYSLDSDIDKTIEDIENEAGPGITDEEAVANEAEKLSIGYAEGDYDSKVTQKLELPKTGSNGTQISWSSDNPSLISPEGIVNRPSYLTGNFAIVLTAIISKGDSIVTKTFKITVLKLPITDVEAVNIAKDKLAINYSPGDSALNVKNKLLLPTSGPEGTTITWSSNPTGSVLEDGTIIRPSSIDKNITITATIKKNGVTTTKDFLIIILKKPTVNDESSSSSNTEKIVVDVDGKDGTNLTKTPITRTTDSNGKVKDHVSMSEDIAKETVNKARQQGTDTARIIIPDTNDKVSEIVVEIPKSALKQLNDGKMKLEIAMENAVISIPTNSLSTFNEDLYFKVIPIKSKEQQKLVEERAKKEKLIQDVAKNQTVQLLGRPMEIDTNMQSREVSIILPLKEGLPSDAKARDIMLENLVVFVEHSDGTKEIVRGKVVPYQKNTELGLEFSISKFSTFSIVYMDGAKAFFDGKGCGTDTLSASSIGCLSIKKSVPVYELVNNRLKKVDILIEEQAVPAYDSISPMLGLGGDIWVERTNAIRYETPSKSMLDKNALTGTSRLKQIWKGLELRPGQIGKVTILEDTVIWEKINKTKKIARILKKGEQYRVYRYVPGMYSIGDGKYVVQGEQVILQK